MAAALHIAFKVGPAEYALPASQVLHMESFTGATPVPGAPAYVAGLVQIRQKVVPVIDVRARFGLPPVPPELGTRVIVVQVRDRTVGLLVDSAREVLRLDEDQIRDPPDAISRQAAGYIRGVAALGDRMVLLIDVERVLGEEGHDGQQQVRA